MSALLHTSYRQFARAHLLTIYATNGPDEYGARAHILPNSLACFPAFAFFLQPFAYIFSLNVLGSILCNIKYFFRIRVLLKKASRSRNGLPVNLTLCLKRSHR